MGLTAEEQKAANELYEILRGPGADAAYDKLPDSMVGKILNADIARELSPRYQTIADRTLFTRATYDPARDYVFKRFGRELKKRNSGIAIILAGGAASGKTTSIKSILSVANLVFDSNCADLSKGKSLVDTAVKYNWIVLVVYIHRNFKVAVESMLKRAISTGRAIPLRCESGSDLATLHYNAQRTFVELDRIYADSERVRTIALRNPWTPDNPLVPTTISVKTLAIGGKRYYSTVEELYVIQDEVVKPFLAANQFTPELRREIGIA